MSVAVAPLPLRVVVGLVVGLVMGACSAEGETVPQRPARVGLDAVFGLDDPEAGPACFLARDTGALRQLWRLTEAGYDDPPPPLPGDLDVPLVGVFTGPPPTGGQEVGIVTVGIEGEAAVVEVALASRVESAPEATSPYALMAVPADVVTARVSGDLDLTCETRVPTVTRGATDGEDTA